MYVDGLVEGSKLHSSGILLIKKRIREERIDSSFVNRFIASLAFLHRVLGHVIHSSTSSDRSDRDSYWSISAK